MPIGSPPGAEDFWGEDSAAVQDALQGPPARSSVGEKPTLAPVVEISNLRRRPRLGWPARFRWRPAIGWSAAFRSRPAVRWPAAFRSRPAVRWPAAFGSRPAVRWRSAALALALLAACAIAVVCGVLTINVLGAGGARPLRRANAQANSRPTPATLAAAQAQSRAYDRIHRKRTHAVAGPAFRRAAHRPLAHRAGAGAVRAVESGPNLVRSPRPAAIATSSAPASSPPSGDTPGAGSAIPPSGPSTSSAPGSSGSSGAGGGSSGAGRGGGGSAGGGGSGGGGTPAGPVGPGAAFGPGRMG